LAPKGTLPFDTEATLPGASEIVAQLRARRDVSAVSPVLGAQLHVEAGSGSSAAAVSAMAIGSEAAVQGDYRLLAGRAPRAGNEVVANDAFLAAVRARVGDTIHAAAGYDPQLRAFTGRRSLAIVGQARFIYMAAGERAIAVPLGTLQEMEGPSRSDRVSIIMVRLRSGADVEATRRTIERDVPVVSAISTATAIQQVEQRLSYFRQLAFILGAVSLVVGFLLVTTLVTVSVNERIGEFAVLRAIGVSRAHVVQQVAIESAALSLAGAVAGLGLGLV